MLSPKLGLISVSVGWFGGAQTEIEKVRFVVRSRGPRPMPSLERRVGFLDVMFS